MDNFMQSLVRQTGTKSAEEAAMVLLLLAGIIPRVVQEHYL